MTLFTFLLLISWVAEAKSLLILGASVSATEQGVADLVASRFQISRVHKYARRDGLFSLGIWRSFCQDKPAEAPPKKHHVILALDLFFHDSRAFQKTSERSTRELLETLCLHSELLLLGKTFKARGRTGMLLGQSQSKIAAVNRLLVEEAAVCPHAVVIDFEGLYETLYSREGKRLTYGDRRTYFGEQVFEDGVHPTRLGVYLIGNEILLQLNFQQDLTLPLLETPK